MRPKNLEKENAIRSTALRLIAEEGLENLSMQKLAQAANISPRTIYIKYADKDDLLIKLFIEEVLVAYEKAVLDEFEETMSLEEGVKKIWTNTFRYFRINRPAFVLMQYGKSSPLLNKAFQEKNIKEGDHFSAIHRFMKNQVNEGVLHDLPFQVHRALLFAPVLDLINEYFDFQVRQEQIITEEVMMKCCDAVIKGMKINSN